PRPRHPPGVDRTAREGAVGGAERADGGSARVRDRRDPRGSGGRLQPHEPGGRHPHDGRSRRLPPTGAIRPRGGRFRRPSLLTAVRRRHGGGAPGGGDRGQLFPRTGPHSDRDRKSTRLNSSHVKTSYAVFFLKKTTHST